MGRTRASAGALRRGPARHCLHLERGAKTGRRDAPEAAIDSLRVRYHRSSAQFLLAYKKSRPAPQACKGLKAARAPPRARARTMSKASALYVLHEAASGYALLDVVELDAVAA